MAALALNHLAGAPGGTGVAASRVGGWATEMIRGALGTLLVVAGGCLATGPSQVGLGEEFVIRASESVRIAGTELTVGFRRVVGDSRCPLDAICVVEGGAGVELALFGSEATDPVLVATPFPRTWSDGRYEVTAIHLDPQPLAGRAIDPQTYRVRLRVNLAP